MAHIGEELTAKLLRFFSGGARHFKLLVGLLQFGAKGFAALQAPFEWPDDDRDQLIATLEQFRFPSAKIPIQLSGFGAFPPRVIYLDVEHTDELMALKAALSRYLAETLNVVDKRERDRPYRPHLTVAFRDLKPANFRRAWPEFEHKPAQFSFYVPAITLLRHNGRHWTIDQNFEL